MQRSLKCLSAVALVMCSLAACTNAQTYMAGLDAANQVPVLTDADVEGAAGSFMMTVADGVATYTLDAMSLSNFTMAHIHIGNATENGPILVVLVPVGEGLAENGAPPLLADPISGDYTVTANFTSADFAAPYTNWTWDEFMQAVDESGLYVNIHTVEYPGGAIRGQLMAETTSMAPMSEAPMAGMPMAAMPMPAMVDTPAAEAPAAATTTPASSAIAPFGKAAAMFAAAFMASAFL